MGPLVAWLIGAAAAATYEYFRSNNAEKSFVGVGWSGSLTSPLPVGVVRAMLHEIVTARFDYGRFNQNGGATDYVRGDDKITCLPTSRSVRWREVPLFLSMQFSSRPDGCDVEFKFAAPPNMTFNEACMAFFHEHAKSEFDEIFDVLIACIRAAASGGPGRERARGGYAAGDAGAHDHAREAAREDAERDADYALLGLKRGASWSLIQSAYRDACLKYHPDRLQGQHVPQHLIDLAVREFQARTDAYQRLKTHLTG